MQRAAGLATGITPHRRGAVKAARLAALAGTTAPADVDRIAACRAFSLQIDVCLPLYRMVNAAAAVR